MNALGNYQWDSNYPNEEVFKKDISLSQLWVAEVDSAIAGISAITTDQEPEYAEAGWDITEPAIVTHRLAVNVNFRGMGIARALLMKAEEEELVEISRCSSCLQLPRLQKYPSPEHIDGLVHIRNLIVLKIACHLPNSGLAVLS